jgi:hypothetical protein
MKNSFTKPALASLIMAGITGMMLAHAQLASSGKTTTSRPKAEVVSPELAAELQAVEQLPTIEPSTLPRNGLGGTFYSAQCPYWPPLPGNTLGLPVWNLGDGHYLINDLSIDYPALDAATAQSAPTTTSAKMLTMSLSSGSGRLSPNGLTQLQSGVPYLTITLTNASQALVTVLNDTGPANYELLWTPVLANPAYPWAAIAVGNTGQTNFTVNVNVYPTGFYRAVQDTNAIPLWEAADPNNQAAGILNVWIDTPANGTTLN